MKTRRETRKEDDPLPILYQETEQNTYIILDIRSAKYERFIKTFLKRDQELCN